MKLIQIETRLIEFMQSYADAGGVFPSVESAAIQAAYIDVRAFRLFGNSPRGGRKLRAVISSDMDRKIKI